MKQKDGSCLKDEQTAGPKRNSLGTNQNRFICTYTVAHHLYLIASHLASNRSVQVTAGSAAFWSDVLGIPIENNDFIPGVSGTHTVKKGVGRYQRFWRAGAAAEIKGEKAIRRLIEVGDAYMRVGGRYAGKEGRMSEQFHRYVPLLRTLRRSPPALPSGTSGTVNGQPHHFQCIYSYAGKGRRLPANECQKSQPASTPMMALIRVIGRTARRRARGT